MGVIKYGALSEFARLGKPPRLFLPYMATRYGTHAFAVELELSPPGANYSRWLRIGD